MVLMFNLALSFHSSALQHSSVTRLLRAKTLYEFAFQMHLEENSDVTLLYSLALMNNLGLAHTTLHIWPQLRLHKADGQVTDFVHERLDRQVILLQ